MSITDKNSERIAGSERENWIPPCKLQYDSIFTIYAPRTAKLLVNISFGFEYRLNNAVFRDDKEKTHRYVAAEMKIFLW